MLTDEEITKFIGGYKNGVYNMHGLIFAIQEAVLAKAMPIPKQEPVGFIDSEGDPHLSVDGLKGGYLYIGDAPVPAQAAAIPEGWQLVPVEPTNEMCDAYCEHAIASTSHLSVRGYKAMLSASPKPE